MKKASYLLALYIIDRDKSTKPRESQQLSAPNISFSIYSEFDAYEIIDLGDIDAPTPCLADATINLEPLQENEDCSLPSLLQRLQVALCRTVPLLNV